jgi:hypothetical protein
MHQLREDHPLIAAHKGRGVHEAAR